MKILQVRSDNSVMFRGIQGPFKTVMVVTIQDEAVDVNFPFRTGLELELKPVGSSVWTNSSYFGPSATELRISDVEVGQEYNIRARFVYGNETLSPWTTSWGDPVETSHTVQGNLQLPPDLLSFAVTQAPTGDAVDFNWSFNWTPFDLIGVELRYGAIQDWDTMIFLAVVRGGAFSTSSIPEGEWWFAARPINYAVNPTDANKQLGNYAATTDWQLFTVRRKNDGLAYWAGYWAPGVYLKDAITYNKGWLAFALTDTEEAPLVHAEGQPVSVLESVGTPTFAQSNATSNNLIVGQRYQAKDFDSYVKTVRVWIPDDTVGFRLDIVFIKDPVSIAPEYHALLSKYVIQLADTEDWLDFPVGYARIPEGTEFEILAVFTPTTGTTSFTHEWSYIRSNSDPVSGEITQGSGNKAVRLKVHKEDSGAIDRSLELDNIEPGSEIEMVTDSLFWTIREASKSGDIYTFVLDPPIRAATEGLSDFTFTYFGTLAIHYVSDTDFYIGTAEVEGLYSITGYSNIAVDENAYGVDILLQQIVLPIDWEVVPCDFGY